MTKFAFTVQIQGVLEVDDKHTAGWTLVGALLRLQPDVRLPVLSVELPDIWEWDGKAPSAVAEILADGGEYQCYNCGSLWPQPGGAHPAR